MFELHVIYPNSCSVFCKGTSEKALKHMKEFAKESNKKGVIYSIRSSQNMGVLWSHYGTK